MPAAINPTPFVIHPAADLLQKHPQLSRMSNALSLKYAHREMAFEQELKDMGFELWRFLECDQAFDQAAAASGAEILPIVVQSREPAILQLPWETLFHPKRGFLGKSLDFTLWRRIVEAPDKPVQLEKGPLRVLLFTSLPTDLDAERSRLHVEEEQESVQEALMPWIAQGLVRLEMPNDGRLATLAERLKRFQPHLLFLSGHGKFFHEPHSDQPPYGTFLFEAEDGRSDPVAESELAKAFIGSGVKCVVLSACESGKAASDSLNNGLTRQLALLGIPHVIGMRESILDRAGIGFARAFCDAIAREERIDLALQEARQAISQPLKEEPLYKDNADLVGELSLGQWCLPALISKDGALPLIDWDFTPGPEDKPRIQQRLKSVSLPKRFVGRRMELRRLERSLANGAINRVLITGPGGQGKTALGGKLARFLQERGYLVRDWSAINPEGWSGFVLDLELLLSKENVERYDRIKASTVDESGKARRLLELLSAQSQNRIALFFDNLESLQDPETLELSDPIVKAWMQAAGALSDQALVLLATSRWRLNGFSDSEQVKLEHASYGDFLQMAREEKLPRQLMYERDRLRRVYQTLHGNGRALHFFAAAIQGMKLEQEEVFLQKLAQTQAEIQTNMAIEAIVGHLDDEAQELLQRLPVYQDPVPIEGIIKLGLDLPKEPEALLNRLLDLSLVEESYNYQWHCREYLCSPLVSEWLDKQGRISLDEELLQIAAVYQEYLYTNERKTLNQAIVVHKALRAAEQKDKADRFALDNVVGTMGLYGFYRTLLDQWLPDICQSENAWVRAAALNQTGKQCLHIGDYDTALEYLKKSLAIRQEIGDKSGEGTTLNNISQIYDARGDYDTALEYLKKSLAIRQEIVDVAGLCATLFNMGHIHLQNKEIQEAMQCWVQVYMLAKRVNLAAVLNALEDLSGHLGMQGGLQAWEDIAAQFQRDKSDDE